MNHRTVPLVIVGAVLVVAFSVASGVQMLRSPFGERPPSDDDRRIDDLVAVTRAIEEFVADGGKLPGELDDLTPKLVRRSRTRDPDSEDPYEYRVTGPRAFELCAEFDEEESSPDAGERWRHDEGRQCFALEAAEK
jgi:hypothetical protein